MKKTVLVLSAVIIFVASFATRYKIKVSDNQFRPATVNARVGDTILWVWEQGDHTTTSTSIPGGAKAWDKPIDQSNPKYKYIIKVAGTYKYYCSFHPFMTGKIVVSASPVALNDLYISEENARALLSWSANSVSDVSYFSVQRSKDGSNFTEIAKVQPSSSLNYKYADQTDEADQYTYYQVELVDKNGNSSLSEIKMFTNQTKLTKLITSISPNPVSSPGHLMLQFNAEKDGKMLVQLYGSGGELIKQAEMTAVKGVNNGHFHLGDLKSGSYYIVCTLGSIQEKYTIMYQ